MALGGVRQGLLRWRSQGTGQLPMGKRLHALDSQLRLLTFLHAGSGQAGARCKGGENILGFQPAPH
jgi:hypothetical protein